MAVHDDHGLLVYVDVSPSEQITLLGNKTISMVGVVVDEDEGVPGLNRDFKKGS